MVDDWALPVIDLAPLADGVEGRARVAADLRAAFEDAGFLILINHGVAPELIKRTFAEAKRFHAQSMEAKHAVLMNEHNNGYMSLSRYNVHTSRVSEDAAKPDLNEAFFIKRERAADDPMILENRRFGGRNEWPADLPGFREAVLNYTDTIDALARRMLPALAEALEMPTDFFDAAFAESQFSFRMSHYPKVATREDGQYGIAPHTDANFLTFLAQSGMPGLQVRSPAGTWRDVPFVENSFVVNSGDMLHRWTNGRFKSTPHRALPPLDGERYAIPYFLGPHLDTMIACMPTCQGPDNLPRFPPLTYADYMAWWYDANYPHEEQGDLVDAAE